MKGNGGSGQRAWACLVVNRDSSDAHVDEAERLELHWNRHGIQGRVSKETRHDRCGQLVCFKPAKVCARAMSGCQRQHTHVGLGACAAMPLYL